MKIGLILPGSYWFAPYVKIYEDVLESNSINYDVISWDRDGLKDSNIISFKLIESANSSRPQKLLNYLKYKRFVIDTIKEKKYDKLIVFGPQTALLLFSFLKKNYKNNFFLDYRDVSIEQYFKFSFKKLLNYCGGIAISSPGFKKVLPKNRNYLISHNFRLNMLQYDVSDNLKSKTPFDNDIVVISTIGAIRDISANMELVNAFRYNNEYEIKFIGKGSNVFENLGVGYENIICKGFYEKEQESSFFIESDFLNIYYPDIITHSTALSNRFYNALIYKRPMIVKSNSIQADFVNKYQLGLSLDNCQDLDLKIKLYVEKFSFDEFSERCDKLLNEFLIDFYVFEEALVYFVK